jgi:hypothetical protein
LLAHILFCRESAGDAARASAEYGTGRAAQQSVAARAVPGGMGR